MKHITYTSEKMINDMRKKEFFSDRTLLENVVITVYDKLFCDCGYYGATLKEFEQYLGHKLDNNIQINICYMDGINGLEYMTKRNARYIGTNDLSYVNIDDFNLLVKQAYETR
jgi:hypothetical protein